MIVRSPRILVSSLPWANELDYNGTLKARHYLDDGMTYDLLYFWFNVTKGHYNHLPESVLNIDRERELKKYPEFKTQILTWKSNI